MVDFVLGRLKFTYQGNWTNSFAYIKDDIVTYGGRTYVCVTNHTSNISATGFYADSSNWNLISDGIQYKGAWTTGTYYKVNDLVKYGANIWICTTGHTAGATFQTTESNFTVFVNGLEYVNTYSGSTQYTVGDIVTYGGYVYAAKQDTLGNLPTNATYWSIVTTGYNPRGTWSSSTAYTIGDVVNYGAYSYVAEADNSNSAPFPASTNWNVVGTGFLSQGAWSNSTPYKLGDVVTYGGYSYAASVDNSNQTPNTSSSYWSLVSSGVKFIGAYSGATAYKQGDIATYGGYSYIAKQDTTGNAPTNGTYWSQLTTGFSYQGAYSNTTTYLPGQVVSYSGYTYITQSSTVGQNPSNTSVWTVVTPGFNYAGAWSNATSYNVGDSVNYGGSTYVSVTYGNVNNAPNTALSTPWTVLAAGTSNTFNLTTPGDLLYYGAGGGLTRLPIGANNQSLLVSNNLPIWANNAVATANVYYVAITGSDTFDGKTIGTAFASIQKAAQTVPNNATIFVKTGTYSEVLPITLGAGVTVVGDSQRTTIVQPANSSYSNGTMWRVGDGNLLKSMTFTGMTGFVGNTSTPSDITTATLGGVFVGFNPASPITTKSPYIFECSAISTGGIGAYVDGSVHASGNKSMLFHAYTQINNDGVGYYINNGARAEVVSCFTYYCWFGLATANGGYIRGLNNNNSYGRYGASSRGYDASETPITGTLTGNMLGILVANSAQSFTQGEYIRGNTSGANGYVFTHQVSSNTLYYSTISGTFTNNEVITGSSSGVNATITTTGNGQSGFILVANGLPYLPNTGGSIIFSSGDTGNAYVIQSVSGSYVNTQSNVIITLANQKTYPSPGGNNFVIRYNYSQIRLMGHDFLNIGTGNTTTTNYPGTPVNPPVQSQQVSENYPGRVFYVATDQSGNFYVGTYFNVQQATGVATLNSSAFNLSGLSSLRLGSIGAQLGESINEFSSDPLLSANSINKVPTQSAVTQYVASKAGVTYYLDDISYQFDGQQKSFNLTYSNSSTSGISLTVFNAPKLDIKIGNAPVNPATRLYDYQNLTEISSFQSGFYLSNSNTVVNFATAPSPGMSFYGTVRNVNDSVNDFSYLQNLQTPFNPLNIMLGA
jgi:hypothetical protein